MAASSLTISVESTIKKTVLALEAKTNAAVQASTVRALNRTATSVRKDAVTEIRKKYKLKSGTIRAQMVIVKASRNRLIAQIIASGKRIPLIEFSARAVNPWNKPGRSHKRRGGGVSVNMTGARTLYAGKFIATMPKSGHVGVFERYGGGIRQLVGISVPRALAERHINAALAKLAAERFAVEFQRDLNYRLGVR